MIRQILNVMRWEQDGQCMSQRTGMIIMCEPAGLRINRGADNFKTDWDGSKMANEDPAFSV